MGGSTSRLTACSLLGGRGTGGTSSRSSGPEMNGQQSEAAQEFAGRWRGAALARDQGPRIFFPGLGRPKHWVKQAAPAELPTAMFCPAVGSNRQFRAPRDKPSGGSLAGAACLKEFVAVHALKKNAQGPVACVPKRLPSSVLLAPALVIAPPKFAFRTSGSSSLPSCHDLIIVRGHL
jgi:hypothetical protein